MHFKSQIFLSNLNSSNNSLKGGNIDGVPYVQTSQLQEEGEKCTDIREEYTEEQVQYISTC